MKSFLFTIFLHFKQTFQTHFSWFYTCTKTTWMLLPIPLSFLFSRRSFHFYAILIEFFVMESLGNSLKNSVTVGFCFSLSLVCLSQWLTHPTFPPSQIGWQKVQNLKEWNFRWTLYAVWRIIYRMHVFELFFVWNTTCNNLKNLREGNERKKRFKEFLYRNTDFQLENHGCCWEEGNLT